jgi:hypothetical protein
MAAPPRAPCVNQSLSVGRLCALSGSRCASCRRAFATREPAGTPGERHRVSHAARRPVVETGTGRKEVRRPLCQAGASSGSLSYRRVPHRLPYPPQPRNTNPPPGNGYDRPGGPHHR